MGVQMALRLNWLRCARQAVDAVKAGHNVLVLSDRGVDADYLPIPALLATSAIHQHLVESGLRTSTGPWWLKRAAHVKFITFAAWRYGAEAVHPYLAFATLTDMVQHGLITGKSRSEAIAYFIKGVGKGMQSRQPHGRTCRTIAHRFLKQLA